MSFHRFISAALLTLSMATVPRFALAAPDYSDAGPFAVSTSALASGVAGSSGGSLVVPTGTGPFPLLITSHGWSAASAQQLGWAQHFASWGFVVAVPTFPNSLTPNATVDEGIIEQLVAIYGDAGTVSPAQGKVDPTRVGLEGHSAGGLATTLAASKLNPAAVVLFDPVDASDAGEPVYANLCVPLLDIFASPSSCNNQSEWYSFATKTTAPLAEFHVVGSSHCDGENQDRGAACGAVCGGNAAPARQAVYAYYGTAFFLAHLQGDSTAAAVFDTSVFAADTRITEATIQPASSTCSSDGGVVTPPPPHSDAGALADSGSPVHKPDAATVPGMDAGNPIPGTDAGQPIGNPGADAGGAGGSNPGTNPPSGNGGGGGCALGGGQTNRGFVWLMAFAGALVARRRRHAS